MAWTLNGIRIFPQKKTDDRDNIIAKLNPVGGGAFYHIYGYDAMISKVSAFIVGETDKAALEALAYSSSSVTLSGAGINWGDFYVKHVSVDMIQSISQTLRTDLSCDANVYTVDIELWKD